MNDYNPSVSLYSGIRSNAFLVRCLKDKLERDDTDLYG